MLPTREWLGKNIRNIIIGTDLVNNDYVSSHVLPWLKYMAWCFFLSLDPANEAFLYTYLLSHKTFDDSSIGTPIILNLYLNETIKFVAIHNATNSVPKTELSTVFCLLEYQIIGTELQYKIFAVWDWRVALSLALSQSTKQLTWTGFPLVFGEFGVISYPATTYKSFIAWTWIWTFWSMVAHW